MRSANKPMFASKRTDNQFTYIESDPSIAHYEKASNPMSFGLKIPRTEETDISREKYQTVWFIKQIEESYHDNKVISAIIEVIAQEFYRLMLPHQPKTRLIANLESDMVQVASKAIPSFTDFDSVCQSAEGLISLSKKLASNELKHLGQVYLYNIYLDEGDFQLANFAFDGKGRCLRIDSESSLSSFQIISNPKFKYSPLTKNKINSLAQKLFKDYVTDFVDKNDKAEVKNNLSLLQQSKYINDDICEATLKVMLIPNELIHLFVTSFIKKHLNYATEDTKNLIFEMAEFLIIRRNELSALHMHDHEFIAYCNSQQATEACQQLINNVSSFISFGKEKLLDTKECETIKSAIEYKFNLLKSQNLFYKSSENSRPLFFNTKNTASTSEITETESPAHKRRKFE